MMPLSSRTEVEKLIKTDPFEDYYEIGPELGRGKFAVVKKCTDKRTNCVYAAKFLRKRRRAVSCREEIIIEIDIMRQAVSHPGVIQLHEVYESQREIVIVLEIAKGGELFRLIAQEPLSEEQAREVTFQILDAISHLHDHGIVHLDLKPENILLAEPEELVIRVADFGLAMQIRPDQQCRNLVGTPEYVAPEILNYEPLSCASDMWSVGAMTYALLAGYSPFQGEEELETFLNVSKVSYDFDDEIFEKVSSEAKDFITRLLRKDANKRMTARKCLEHSWLSKAKRATTRVTAKSKGKQKSDSYCESLSSTDSPYDISQDSTSSLDVSPLSSASSSFSPAAGKPTDDETTPLTPVKTSQPNLVKVTEKVSTLYLERNSEGIVESDAYKTAPTSSSFESSQRISDKESSNASAPKSSPYTTPTGSFGSTRSVKQSSCSKIASPSTSSGSSNVSHSSSDPVITSSVRTSSSCSNSSSVGKSISESIVISPPRESVTHGSQSTSDAATNVNESSQVVLRMKTRGKASTEESPNKNGVVMRRKVSPDSLPNYSRDSYRRNSMNFSDNTSDVDVMDLLRKGSDSSVTMDSVWPPSPRTVPSSPATGGHSATLDIISEDSGANKSLRRKDKSPKISLDAQIALLDSDTDSADATTHSQPLPSPKIPLEAIQELKSELKLGLEKSKQQKEQQRPSEEPKKSPVRITTNELQASSSKNRSKRSSSPKISMEAQLEILDLDISNGNTKPEKHSLLRRKLSQSTEPQNNKNPERTTEWKTLPRRRSNAKPSQSKPASSDTRKGSYTPTGPFQFLPIPNGSRLIDRRPSLPINSSGVKLGASSSTSQLPSRQWNNASPQHTLDRPTTPLSFINHSNPSSRSNSPGTCSPVPFRTATLSPNKISHWKSCEELDK